MTLVACATDWESFVVDRFTGRRLAMPRSSRIAGERVLDTYSFASTEFPKTGGADCCLDMGEIRPWRHELEQWRFGERVWVGPVTGVTESRTAVTVRGADRLAWARRRKHRTTKTLKADPSTLVAQILQDTIGNPKDPIEWRSALQLVGTTSSTSWTSGLTYGSDSLKPLADTSIDFTMINDTLYGGQAPVQRVIELNENHFEATIETDDDGFQFATHVTTRSKDGKTQQWPVSDEPDEYWGLVDAILDRDDLSSASELRSASLDIYKQIGAGTLVINTNDTGKILPGAPVEFHELIPGAHVKLSLPDRCRPIDDIFEMTVVQWRIGAGTEQPIRASNGRFAASSDVNYENVNFHMRRLASVVQLFNA